MDLSVAGHSETGRLLERNTDALVLYDLSDSQQAARFGRLYVLADGTGNHAAGELASRIAVETIPAIYYQQGNGDSPLVRLQRLSMQPIPVFVSMQRCTQSIARWRPHARLL
jgi:serine/threonine protein phosphatase PrpC